MHILVAGFQHETNTFAPSKAGYDNFVRGEGFPAMARGQDVLALRSVNIPAGGFINAIQAQGHSVHPVIWAGASPSAHVTRDAFERIAGEILDAAQSGRYDAVYLDLHGAMVTEHLDDGEGELLARVRQIVGPNVPVVASLDLHANVTAQMLQEADALVAFRTYPHVDMAATGEQAARLLLARIAAGSRWTRHVRRLPFLIPINGMCTMLQPSQGVYETLAQLEQTPGVTSMSFAPGFPAADFPECGPVVWAYGTDAAAVEHVTDTLYKQVLELEPEWSPDFLEPAEAVRRAQALAAGASRPIVIADTQDNPGAGGDANTTGMLRALVEANAQNAALGLVYDPAAVRAATAAGIGQTVTLSLGGQSGVAGDAPFTGDFVVETLSPGKLRFDGPMMHGMDVDLGAVAGLRIGGVRVVVSASKAQMLDRNLFRVGGVQPEEMGILVVKSSVHFRADFQPIAHEVLVAKAPGPMQADPADLPWTRLQPGIRVRPQGKPFNG
ncbi:MULTISPECIES: M81 family metallopeptidase [Achromobacter]|uniref:Microcystinase C n=1 Tax=Achromobacter spanius TaxID=217203 RepID=A0ABY8GUT3_9BURK|nr:MULTISPECIES: M81 family metallopeptidase [Achromobacter]WAI82128.1 M81 family metallopeptidase [Achromobacter spanius]WEX92217.1 M81 family metallopeptidase [Achromobacter sp. SS2-2022]WFP08636.1 M81 family metallopeptidase [Achromobacter spanius]